jgi:hypothetical protein
MTRKVAPLPSIAHRLLTVHSRPTSRLVTVVAVRRSLAPHSPAGLAQPTSGLAGAPCLAVSNVAWWPRRARVAARRRLSTSIELCQRNLRSRIASKSIGNCDPATPTHRLIIPARFLERDTNAALPCVTPTSPRHAGTARGASMAGQKFIVLSIACGLYPLPLRKLGAIRAYSPTRCAFRPWRTRLLPDGGRGSLIAHRCA